MAHGPRLPVLEALGRAGWGATLARVGLAIEVAPDEDGTVDRITFRLSGPVHLLAREAGGTSTVVLSAAPASEDEAELPPGRRKET